MPVLRWTPPSIQLAVFKPSIDGKNIPHSIQPTQTSLTTMSIPTSQRALILPQKHGKFIVETYPVEKPGTGELLVRIESVSLNPIDWIVQALGVLITDYPAILGLDSAGVVAAVGEGVTSFAVGDKV